MNCVKCGRRIAVYFDEIGNRWLGHAFPFALHRAALPDDHPLANPLSLWERLFPKAGSR